MRTGDAYDLVVIGAGAAGKQAATTAARVGRRVLLIESRAQVGGSWVNSGTIPSKTLRQAALYLSGYNEHGLYGNHYAVLSHITMQDLLKRTEWVMQQERDAMQTQIAREGVELIYGTASFTDPHTLAINDTEGRTTLACAQTVIIATGTEATPVSRSEIDGQHIFTSDEILGLKELPKHLTIVGAGVIGCEYASIFAILGTHVTLIDARPTLLPFIDRGITDELIHYLRKERVTMRLGESVEKSEVLPDGSVQTTLKSGKVIICEAALHSIGRNGATSRLQVQNAGLTTDERGRLSVDESFRTSVPHIYAVGDVIGFPSLASTSMMQAWLAAMHACNLSTGPFPAIFPYGIYTIPEISMVGKTEEELTAASIPYEVGEATFGEAARALIMGVPVGKLKMLFHRETRELLGVHILGETASELIHIGQAVMSFKGTIDYFVNAVFNDPTLGELYKVASLDGLQRIGMAAHDARATTSDPLTASATASTSEVLGEKGTAASA